jgi:DNA repair protein RadB
MIKQAMRTPSGIPPLDRLLGGGFHRAVLNLIYGEAATGKTTLSLTTAFYFLNQNKASKAFYLDIDNKLNTVRLEQIARSQGTGLLKRIHLYTPKDFRNQGDVFEQLPSLFNKDMLIIDSITGLYRGETEDAQKTFAMNKELNRQLGYLTEITKTTGSTMLLTGQVRSRIDTRQIEPVAKRLLEYWGSTIIRMDKTGNPENRQATLEKPDKSTTPIILTMDKTGLKEQSP